MSNRLKKMTVLASLFVIGAASAQGTPISITNTMSRVTTVSENGKAVEKFTEVKGGVLPNEIIQFTYKYQNVTKTVIKGNTLNTVVPAATLFQSQQCDTSAAKALFSIDKQVLNKDNQVTNVNTMKFAAAPLKKTVTVKENGVDVKKEVAVSPSEYTAVRWLLPDIQPGQTFTCTMRVRVK